MLSLLTLRNLLVLCYLCTSLTPVQAEAALQNTTLNDIPNEIPAMAAACDSNSSTRLTFVTSLSIRGCPLFVHRLGEVKAGRFVLEPTFCVASSDAWRRPSAHYDLLAKESYFSFPVNVTDELLLSEVQTQLRRFAPKSVAFLEVASVRLNYTESFAFESVAFVWDPTENVGHIRMVCGRLACQSLALYLSRGQPEVFESIRLSATLQINQDCAPIAQTYPVTIAHAPQLPIKSLQRPRHRDLKMCSDLHLFKVVQLGNCTAYVHQSQGKKGHFVIEPLLCPTAAFSVLTDYSVGRHYLKLSATVEDSAVVDAVKSRLASSSPQSIEFLKLWNASIHVSDKLSRWEVQPLRLSTDRQSGELRVYCANLASCDLLGAVLNSEPVNFWKHIQWTATSVFNDECEFRSDKRRFAFRMKERESAKAMPSTGGKWNLKALRNRTVTRDGRTFIVVLQRGCRTSNFQRNWVEYVEGFGDNYNFWIGLNVLHSFTHPQDTTMRVEMLLWNETEWYGEYSGFTVGNSSTNYRMSYTAMNIAKSSLVFDAMSHSVNMPFSSRDVDNHVYSSRYYCSHSWSGYAGWWFQSCANANPNGVYSFGESASTVNAVWYFREGYKALKEFRMMLQI